MDVRLATESDLSLLMKYDRHIAPEELKSLIGLGRILLAEEDGVFLGWLRWGLFWDNIPFMNMLWFPEQYRCCGYGRKLVSFWEEMMRRDGYRLIMTSTQSDETAQHFYRKLGYIDSGSLLLPEEPLEIIFIKRFL